MATDFPMDQVLRFQIDPQLGETARARTAIARSLLSNPRGAWLLLGLLPAIGFASYFLTPATRMATFFVAMISVLGTGVGARTIVRLHARRLQAADSHSTETCFVEISEAGVRTWCSHIDARLPWADFIKATEDNEFFLLVRPDGSGAVIPKRLLDEAAEAELRDRLGQWSPDGGRHLARAFGS
jgi:hypothetical protein